MLRSLTQFEIRVIEQALISHFSPKLNSSNSIIYRVIVLFIGPLFIVLFIGHLIILILFKIMLD